MEEAREIGKGSGGRSERRLALFLRVNAVVLLPAFAAVVLPTEDMGAIHAALGLGDWPGGRLVAYLARTESVLYGTLGVLALYVSWDVRRYLPLLGFAALLGMLLGPVFLAVDLAAGLPPAWAYSEGPLVFLLGAVQWRLVAGVRREAGAGRTR